MSLTWFCPNAEEIHRQDAAAWKKRALESEAKLSAYRRLRETCEEIHRAVCESDVGVKARAIDEMAEELNTLDFVGDKPRDVFDQTVSIGGHEVRIASKAGIGQCSMMDVQKGVIVVEQLQPEEGKAIGLFFQVLQLADMSHAASHDVPTKLDSAYLHSIVPLFLSLCADLGLLTSTIKITGSSIEAYLATMEKLAEAKAASTPG